MEIGLRCLALIIDSTLCFFSIPVIFVSMGWLIDHTGPLGILLFPMMFVLIFVWPILFLGIPTGLWGRTPGRWLCRLKVVHVPGRRMGLWRGLGRETLKLLAVGSGIGAALCMYQLLTLGTTWYDQLCETYVEHDPWVRLTPTQRNFRKRYKPPRL